MVESNIQPTPTDGGSKNKLILKPSIQEAVFQQARGIVRENQGLFAAIYEPSMPYRLSAVTQFSGYTLKVMFDRTENETTESVDLVGDDGERYRLDVTYGKEVNAKLEKRKKLIESKGSSSDINLGVLLSGFSESLGDQPAELSDYMAEVNMSAEGALTILKNTKAFELPNWTVITLEDLMHQNAQARAILLEQK